jgi:cytochrome oxidase complex assembly protein 1
LNRCVANRFVTEVEKIVDQPPISPGTPRPNWWKRNWKWFVPLGCFGVALLFVAFVGSILLIVFSAVKSTDVYKDALARAKAHPAVIEALGSPITQGFLLSGNTNVNGASGDANLSIPISGPKGKGTIYVAATKSLGRWNYSGLVLEIAKTHQRIDLLQGSTPASSP